MEEKYALLAQKMAFKLGAIAFIIFLFMLKLLLADAAKTDNQFFCGTKSPENTVRGIAVDGRMLFINNCAVCHAKSMKDDLTGPALIYWRQFLGNEKELLFYLKNAHHYPRKKMNKAFRASHERFEGIECMAYPDFTETDIAALVAYIENSRVAY
jgi:cytochrome c2